jgi:hypothetical protein
MEDLFKKLFKKLFKRAKDGIDAGGGIPSPELGHAQPNLGAPTTRLVDQQTESFPEDKGRGPSP